MSTHSPHSRSELERMAHRDDLPSLITALLQLGDQRQQEEAAGGPLLAAFGDFCWARSATPSARLFDEWLTDAGLDDTHPLADAGAVDAARSALGVRA